jgi:hypothetical protein
LAVATAENPAEKIEKIVCPRCCAVLDAGDNYCRHCGQPTRDSLPDDSRPIATTARKSNWAESRGFVLVMLFVVLGPLALPMLWRSRNFSMAWKIILTVTMIAVTVFIIFMIWYTLYIALEPLRQFREGKF